MPFKSLKQERWMWSNNPSMARKWEDKYGSYSANKMKNKKAKVK